MSHPRPLRVTILEHAPDAPAGWLGEALARAGVGTQTVRLHAGEPLPDLEEGMTLVILGGPMGAYDEDAHPVLVEEKRLLRAAHAASVPVLGICLGAQLLADALGGRAYLGERPEYGYVPVQLTPQGRRDPVVGRLGGELLSWHQDTFDLPPGATLLARSDRYPQAFRLGRTLGLQFHAETPPDDFATWVAGTEAERMAAAGVTPEAALADSRSRREESAERAAALFDAWIEHVRHLP